MLPIDREWGKLQHAHESRRCGDNFDRLWLGIGVCASAATHSIAQPVSGTFQRHATGAGRLLARREQVLPIGRTGRVARALLPSAQPPADQHSLPQGAGKPRPVRPYPRRGFARCNHGGPVSRRCRTLFCRPVRCLTFCFDCDHLHLPAAPALRMFGAAAGVVQW
jgi:hypothetical protein